MTIRQRQHLLAYLGYYVGNVDGDWGSASRAACTAFQKDAGITADGHGGPETDKALRNAVAKDLTKPESLTDSEPTGTFWDEIEFFTREEFRCQCGGKYCDGFPVEPDETLVRTVDEIRRRLGVPVQIVTAGGSGVRCPRHNASPQVGGVPTSLHLQGKAADLHANVSVRRMAQVAEEVMGATGEIGYYSWGIHVGIGKYSRFNG